MYFVVVLLIPEQLYLYFWRVIIATVLGSVTMTVSINTRTWVEVSEVISSKTSNKATLDPT